MIPDGPGLSMLRTIGAASTTLSTGLLVTKFSTACIGVITVIERKYVEHQTFNKKVHTFQLVLCSSNSPWVTANTLKQSAVMVFVTAKSVFIENWLIFPHMFPIFFTNWNIFCKQGIMFCRRDTNNRVSMYLMKTKLRPGLISVSYFLTALTNNGMNLVTCASKLKVVRGIPGQLI